MIDNTLSSRGEGDWVFVLYNPIDAKIGPISGILKTNKDFHIITDAEDDSKCIASFPNQNIAYTFDSDYYEK